MNIETEMLYNNDKVEHKTPIFSIYWDLTTNCLNHCKHCYVKRNDIELSILDCKKIINDFNLLIKRLACKGKICFSGGDPLLYPEFLDLIDYIRDLIPDVILEIIGNPELLNEEILESLTSLKIQSYQLSLDGLKKTHDYFRYEGSYAETLKKIELLQSFDIKVKVLSTINKYNVSEAPKLVDLMVDNEVDVFDFRRFVPISNDKFMKDKVIKCPTKFRDLLSVMEKKYEQYEGYSIKFRKKCPLWKLYDFEEGKFELPVDSKGMIWSGCPIGSSGIIILADGSSLACRTLPIKIGKVPEEDIANIFLYSKKLNKMRNFRKLQKCGKCELFPYCRGCRALAYAIEGNYFAPDPNCWKK